MSTDYSKMSDFEINNLVAISLGAKVTDSYRVGEERETVYYSLFDDEFAIRRGFGNINEDFDPCNKPADAWPIIIDNKISIVSLDNKWIAAPIDTVIDGVTGDSEVCFYASSDAVFDVNPLRAAMIVFLMMQESKNAS